jgi:hypothetical protein
LIALASFYALRELGKPDVGIDPVAAWWNPLRHWTGETVLIGVAAISGMFSLLALNVNLTGPHKLYRDKLARTFVRQAPRAAGLRLGLLNESGLAPYHLINATVNLPSSTSPVLRDRKGDFFLFSKHWIGSTAVGY